MAAPAATTTNDAVAATVMVTNANNNTAADAASIPSNKPPHKNANQTLLPRENPTSWAQSLDPDFIAQRLLEI